MIILKKENKQKNKEKKKKEKPILTEEQIKKRKTRNTRIAACCFLLLLGVGVAGNWYWENSDISAKMFDIANPWGTPLVLLGIPLLPVVPLTVGTINDDVINCLISFFLILFFIALIINLCSIEG